MMENQINTIEDLYMKVIEFRDLRDWKQFHNPKDLAISLSIEASELLEIFQWKSQAEIMDMLDSQVKTKIEEEAADIMIYLLTFCHEASIDLAAVVSDKLEKNDKKYPVSKAKGSSKKYNQL